MESVNPKTAHLTRLRTQLASTGLLVRVGGCLILAALMSGVFLVGSTASSLGKSAGVGSRFGDSRGLLPILRVPMRSAFLPAPPPPPTVATYAGDCTTSKTVFNLQDTDLTVCAKVTGANPNWRIIWSNSNFVAVQNVPVGTGTSTFTLTPTSSLGDWRVILYDAIGGTVQGVTTFTVIDAANPSADVSVSTSGISNSASSGGQVLFAVQITNGGPSPATAVQLTDTVPANTTFVSFDQLSGPVFTCTNPASGGTGDSVCTVDTLARGETASFVGTYTVGAVSAGTVISDTASETSTTADPNPNNSSTATLEVVATACQLSTPSNITQDADPGQAGAVVTYATPTGTGDCGTDSVGEGGETIPAISCNPASGSFFAAGTSTVICSSQTGAAVSFQVTVNNPGGLAISLHGANPQSVECGDDFNDAGASAVNGTGQSVPVTVAYSNCTSCPGTVVFNPDGPAVGSYTATYTATEGANSVSTTRTINVSDTKAPDITVQGANPYKIQQGSCAPFTDPGATATDGCAGARPVTSSISGPGGATSVNPSVAGTYTVTYTATDGTHQTTATRTVLVGNFPQDEVDQPASSVPPPTITLTGDDQITIECGTPFTDPGATATQCGNSIAVTTSGTVDIHTPGTYSITYTATGNSQTTTATRSVTVTPDNTPPTITLNGANPISVECHTGSFIDPGAVAHDACAGDFAATASGVVDPNTVGTYTIIYNATDPSGHPAAAVTRTVNVVDTTPPTITTCPAARSASANSSCQAAVPDFTSSAVATDLCGGAAVTITQSPAAGTLVGVGTTTVTIAAKDAYNNSSTCQTTFTVTDTTPPTITLNGANPITVECHTSFTDPGATAHDNCSGDSAATASGSVNINVPGTYTITYNADDAAHNHATAITRTVIVQDTLAPTITLKTFHGHHDGEDGEGNEDEDNDGPPNVIWPPNHKYHKIKVTNFVSGVSDSCDTTLGLNSVVIEKVTSDEAENAPGSGNTINDIVIACDRKSVRLRAERIGGGNGRVYTITFKVTDASGNIGRVNVKVFVPKNEDSNSAVDDGPHYTVTNSTCP
jgi:uncharacterized repeat protein (TIGR01451 family)